MKKIIELENVSVTLRENQKDILKNINLSVYEGEFLGIVGESGSGKTTLLRLLQSFWKEEKVIVRGKIKMDFKEKALKTFAILQDSLHSLNPYETIGKQLLETYQKYHKEEKPATQKEKIKDILREIGFSEIESLWRLYPYELSGGMRQRISIALILCCDVELLLADEPTTALDVVNQIRFVEFLRKICHARKISLIYVSHDIRVLMTICHRILVMKEGSIVEENTKEEIWNNPKQEYTKKLIQSVKDFL